jgi:hypothetical protein
MYIKSSDVNKRKVAVFALGDFFDSQVLTGFMVVIFQLFPVASEENNKYFRTTVTRLLKTD